MAQKEREKPLLAVAGLTPEQRNSLLYNISEEPLCDQNPPLRPSSMGDFGVGALVFGASLVTIGAILTWLGNQDDNVIVEFEFVGFFKFKASKETTLPEIEARAAREGVDLDGAR